MDRVKYGFAIFIHGLWIFLVGLAKATGAVLYALLRVAVFLLELVLWFAGGFLGVALLGHVTSNHYDDY